MKYLIYSLFIVFAMNGPVAKGQERLVNVNNVEINVRTIGKGSPILIVHGGPGLNHSYFLPHFKELESKYQLVFIDQRACGKSSGNLDSTQMTIDWFVRDIEAVRKELKLGKVSVLAHSWGGLLGMLYAARYPQNIRSLIISNSVSPKQGEYDQQINQTVSGRYSYEDSTLRSQTINSKAFKEGDLEVYKILFKISFKQTFKEQAYIDSLNLYLPSDFHQKRKTLDFMSKELASYNFYPQLKRIKCRTLIIHGDYDAIPVDLAQNLNRSISLSQLFVISNAGHFPFIEQKRVFFDLIERFISK
ncbi:MAG: alpha/beta fold hydrolase [Cyclobacteriaceae bacterium]|nr:alpha/beta fold hydrolase [Cyclobacteriaceae bacterium]